MWLEQANKGERDEPGGVDEADDVSVEGTVHRVQDSHFSQSLHCEQ